MVSGEDGAAIKAFLALVFASQSKLAGELNRWQEAIDYLKRAKTVVPKVDTTQPITIEGNFSVFVAETLSSIHSKEYNKAVAGIGDSIKVLEQVAGDTLMLTDNVGQLLTMLRFCKAAIAFVAGENAIALDDVDNALAAIRQERRKIGIQDSMIVEELSLICLGYTVADFSGPGSYDAVAKYQAKAAEVIELIPKVDQPYVLLEAALPVSAILHNYSKVDEANDVLANLADKLETMNARSIPRLKHELGGVYGNLAHGYIKTGDFGEAERCALDGYDLLQEAWIEVNLAHALLLQGKKDEALDIYAHYLGLEGEAGAFWDQSISKDFRDYRKAGIDGVAFAPVEQLMANNRRSGVFGKTGASQMAKQPRESPTAKEGVFRGIGVSFKKEGSRLMVSVVLSGSPASKSGVQIGDHVLSINGRSTADLAEMECIALIRESHGEEIDLKVGTNYGGSKNIRLRKDWIEENRNLEPQAINPPSDKYYR